MSTLTICQDWHQVARWLGYTHDDPAIPEVEPEGAMRKSNMLVQVWFDQALIWHWYALIPFWPLFLDPTVNGAWPFLVLCLLNTCQWVKSLPFIYVTCCLTAIQSKLLVDVYVSRRLPLTCCITQHLYFDLKHNFMSARCQWLILDCHESGSGSASKGSYLTNLCPTCTHNCWAP